MSPQFRRATLDSLIQSRQELHKDCLINEASFREEIERVAPEYRAGARNLAHYLALRQHDVREQQPEFSCLGYLPLAGSKDTRWRPLMRCSWRFRSCTEVRTGRRTVSRQWT